MKRMTFLTWAKKDPNDETPLKITLRSFDGLTMCFDSDTPISHSTMEKLRKSWVSNVKKENGVWILDLYED